MITKYNDNCQMNARQKSVILDEEWVIFDLNSQEPIKKNTEIVNLETPIKNSENAIVNLETPVNIFGWFNIFYYGLVDFVEEIFAFRSLFNIR
jgi:hypothetical protein